jgi:hypothetical protein
MTYTEICDTTTLQECFANGTITREGAEACNNRNMQLDLAVDTLNANPDSHIGYTWDIRHFVDMSGPSPLPVFLIETSDGSVYGLNLDNRAVLDLLFRWLFYPNA